MTVHLSELGIDSDPGTEWHPRDKPGARNDDGDLVDLSDEEVGARADKRGDGPPLAAEDSRKTSKDVV